MKANPGGEIAPADVIGRDRLIQRLWETLDRQSVVLVAERRMGKSCVIKKMLAETPSRFLAFYRDVEGIDTPLGFVERVYQDVTAHLGGIKRSARRVRGLLKELAGLEVAGLVKLPPAVAAHWKTILEKSVEDLLDEQSHTVVLFWDELPLMLQKIRAATDDRAAMEVLDTLRALRQTYDRLRMVYTGSIGLHHVASSLREAGHVNDATNDMRTIEVPPLADDDALYLARELIQGEQLACGDLDAAASTITSAVDNIPFYVHHVVSQMKDRGDAASCELAEAIASAALRDPQDPWHLQHYRERLREYYGQDRLPVVLAVLDSLAVHEAGLALGDLARELGSSLDPEPSQTARRVVEGDLELLRGLLILLQRDHYVQQETNNTYVFRFSLLRRWWRLNRSLP